ncbi:hypothetical protein SLEP1_g44609 [Rubroshorea leprosula]|uniref:Uncharacterized protein n=1 Tax=Rubroshorea leprosula TaxID=152421 RepID=A0AAV5LH37_9ROSI|nr:hypothetical protein SLEP1_g44609 [Rubroshorea leprosula]
MVGEVKVMAVTEVQPMVAVMTLVQVLVMEQVGFMAGEAIVAVVGITHMPDRMEAF